jgi:hypothetical protein
MSRFEKLDPDVVGLVLIGAEGCAETQNESWLRDATANERLLFIEHCRELVQQSKGEQAAKGFNFTEFTVDGTGRPYWLKAVLECPGLPEIAREKACKHTRTLRVHDV